MNSPSSQTLVQLRHFMDMDINISYEEPRSRIRAVFHGLNSRLLLFCRNKFAVSIITTHPQSEITSTLLRHSLIKLLFNQISNVLLWFGSGVEVGSASHIWRVIT